MEKKSNASKVNGYLKPGEVVWVSIYNSNEILRYLIITKGMYREEYTLIECGEDGRRKQIAKSGNPLTFDKYIEINEREGKGT